MEIQNLLNQLGIELDKQYCTIGILGMYEVMDLYGLISTDEFGNKYYKEEAIEFASKIFDVIKSEEDISLACESLVELAKKNGGTDNITLIIIKFQ